MLMLVGGAGWCWVVLGCAGWCWVVVGSGGWWWVVGWIDTRAWANSNQGLQATKANSHQDQKGTDHTGTDATNTAADALADRAAEWVL